MYPSFLCLLCSIMIQTSEPQKGICEQAHLAIILEYIYFFQQMLLPLLILCVYKELFNPFMFYMVVFVALLLCSCLCICEVEFVNGEMKPEMLFFLPVFEISLCCGGRFVSASWSLNKYCFDPERMFVVLILSS